MPQLSVGVTATVALSVPARQGRRAVLITNEGSSDEVVRADEDRSLVGSSANIIYNRQSVKFTGAIAERMIWLVSDTAATTVSYTEYT